MFQLQYIFISPFLSLSSRFLELFKVQENTNELQRYSITHTQAHFCAMKVQSKLQYHSNLKNSKCGIPKIIKICSRISIFSAKFSKTGECNRTSVSEWKPVNFFFLNFIFVICQNLNVLYEQSSADTG